MPNRRNPVQEKKRPAIYDEVENQEAKKKETGGKKPSIFERIQKKPRDGGNDKDEQYGEHPSKRLKTPANAPEK